MYTVDYLYQKKFYFFFLVKNLDLMSRDDLEILDDQVLVLIRLLLIRNIIFNIMKEKMFIEVLINMYKKFSFINKVFFMYYLLDFEIFNDVFIADRINNLIRL